MFVYIIPFAGALIGWVISALTLLLLIYPKKPQGPKWFLIQGIFPKYFSRFLAEISQKFPVEQLIKSKLESPAIQQDIEALIHQRLDILVGKLRKQIPMGDMFLSSNFANSLKVQAANELLLLLPELPNALSGKLPLTSLAEQIDKALWELDVVSEIRQELAKLTIIGALIGFFVGLAIAVKNIH